jgi:hypothetical protein
MGFCHAQSFHARGHLTCIGTLPQAKQPGFDQFGALGKWRVRHGQQPVSLDRLAYAYLFALGLAAVRYVWAI